MSRTRRRGKLRLHGLHLLARVALRLSRPLRAKALVDRIGSHLPLLCGVDDARAAVRELFPSGSCLSRALAISATLPGAEIVIGVDAWRSARVTGHAWIEFDSVRIDTNPGSDAPLPDELARLAPVAPPFHRSRIKDRPGSSTVR